MQLPTKLDAAPISRLFYGTDLQRLWNGITTDLERRKSEGITNRLVAHLYRKKKQNFDTTLQLVTHNAVIK